MPRVLICDTLEQSGADVLEAGGVEVDNRPGMKGDALKAAVRAADATVSEFGLMFTATE